MSFYYAFTFKDYVFVPAFLAEFLSLTNYSCIKFSNAIVYHYIVLKSIPDLNSLLFEKLIDFSGPHFFNSTKENLKIFVLDSKNIDLACFVTRIMWINSKILAN